MRWRAVVVAGAVLTLLGSTAAVRPAAAGAIDDSLDFGEAVVLGSIDRQGFELLHAYSHYVEEGPTAAEHYTVVVLADRELAPDLAQDLPRLRAKGAAGKLKAFATTAPTRLALLPEVPTFAELGYRDLGEVIWIGLFTTPDMPPQIQARLRAATLKALQDPKLREAYAQLGLGAASNATPDELTTQLQAASDKQRSVLQAIAFKPE